MKFVSIDVGIKNLSFCLFNKKCDSNYYEIVAWDNIDLTEKYESKCIEIDKNNVCGKPAKFIKDSKKISYKYTSCRDHVVIDILYDRNYSI